jgi:hypothetical protein
MARALDLFESVATIARQMPDSVFTDPEDDWAPIVFMEGKQGRVTMPIHDFFEDELRKDLLCEVVLPAAIENFEATVVVMVVSTWVSKIAADLLTQTGNYIPPSQQPDRIEQVLIIEYTADGVRRKAWAEIERFADKVPQLGEWEDMEGADAMSGRFIEPIVKALKGVRK